VLPPVLVEQSTCVQSTGKDFDHVLSSTVGFPGVNVAAHPVFGSDAVVHVGWPPAFSTSTSGHPYPVTYSVHRGPALRKVSVMCTV
jgi:hypothetical protein